MHTDEEMTWKKRREYADGGEGERGKWAEKSDMKEGRNFLKDGGRWSSYTLLLG
jgi:hypothetical protein